MGWALTTGGTTPEHVGDWLSWHGVECHSKNDASLGDLLEELSAGHKIIVGVRAENLWNPDNPLHEFNQHSANHAIWVTGVDATDPSHPKVIINDSGRSDGAGNVYDLAQFVGAWRESGYFYVATDHAPPDLAKHAEGFDEERGTFTAMADFIKEHIPDVTIAGAAWAVGHVVGEFVGSDLVGTAAHTAASIALHHLRKEPAPALPPPPLVTMTASERDRLFREI